MYAHRTESWMSRDVLQSIAEQQNACMVRAQDCFIVLARIPAGAYTCATAAADNSVPERWSSTHDACHLTRHASHTYVCDHCMCRTSGYSWAGNDQQCRRCGQHQHPESSQPLQRAAGRGTGRPHNSAMCGMCQALGYPCNLVAQPGQPGFVRQGYSNTGLAYLSYSGSHYRPY
ncbi:hypothetical protein COO60DRAFT_486241 [Scenedesmus sp. NREL 46B-D3]|nr:hypothetical protein COO60DRAFT_486241 [Scenedesmus sp. NREL 46B-D3]